MFIIFDLDGTLANGEQRQHFLDQEPKDWDGWHGACSKDAPHHPIISVMCDLIAIGHDVEIWTGRSETTREATEAWLREHLPTGFYPRLLLMRPESDHRADTELKAQWLASLQNGKPDLVFEDRKRMVDMWRSHGIVCVQVAPGDF